jgi:hypothetical protein
MGHNHPLVGPVCHRPERPRATGRARGPWAPSWGSRCPTIRTAGRGGRIPAAGARVTLAIMPQLGPVPGDRVTPPCCGRGSVTPSFSYRFAGGGDGTGSSTGHTGHRSTAASMVRRRAELARSPLSGVVCHKPLLRGRRTGCAGDGVSGWRGRLAGRRVLRGRGGLGARGGRRAGGCVGGGPASRAVDELTDDVGVAGGLGGHTDQDVVQRDLVPVGRPPGDVADGVPGSASMVSSECAQARRYRPVTNSRDSDGTANMSDIGSDSSHGSWSAQGLPKVSPSPSSFHSSESRVLQAAVQVGFGVVLGHADILPPGTVKDAGRRARILGLGRRRRIRGCATGARRGPGGPALPGRGRTRAGRGSACG